MRYECRLLNSYRRAIDPPTRVTSCGKRRDYVRVGSTAVSLPPTFPPEATRIGVSKCHSMRYVLVGATSVASICVANVVISTVGRDLLNFGRFLLLVEMIQHQIRVFSASASLRLKIIAL
jgi:hypothetical protein